MAFDPKKLMMDNLAGFEAALKAAYEQGCEDTRQAILAAAGAPVADSVVLGDKVEAEVRKKKAPRGTVPKILGRMLTERSSNTRKCCRHTTIGSRPRASATNCGAWKASAMFATAREDGISRRI